MGRGQMGSDAGDRYAVEAVGHGSGEIMPVDGSPSKQAGGLDKDSIMKFYKKRTILPQEKLGAAANLKRRQKDMGFAQDDFRLDPEEVAFLRTLKEEHANRRRWRIWHKACLVIWVEMLFIMVGGGIMMSWFNIAPADLGGIQTGGPVVGGGLMVSNVKEDQHALIHSGSGKATMELRAAGAGATASLVLAGEDFPGKRSERFSLSATDTGHFALYQAQQPRLSIHTLGPFGDVDIALDPGATGEVTVHDGISIGAAHVRSRTSNLTLQAANNSDVQVVTTGNGSLQITSIMTATTGNVHVGGKFVVASDAHLASALMVGSSTRIEGDSRLDGKLDVGNEGTFNSHLTVSGRLNVNSESVLRKHVEAKSMDVVDRLDVSGECFIGTSLMDELYIQSHVSSRTLLFDEDHSSLLGSVGSLLLTFPDPADNKIISFPEETGTVLTTISKNSQLESVATLTRGAIGEGFGGAYLAYASISGIVSTKSNVDLGDDDYDLVAINGRLTNNLLIFDKNADGIAMRIKIPDPTFYQGRDIYFPDESGTVLTTSSKISTLERVGALFNGSIVAGFGPAHVQSLISSGSSHLRGNSIVGSDRADSLYISAHITSADMLFDANSNGDGLRVAFPDAEGHTIHFPNETGAVLTSVSDYSTLKHVAGLLSGTLEPGFGAATVASVHVTGATALDSDVVIGMSSEEALTIKSTIISQELIFDANRDGRPAEGNTPAQGGFMTVAVPDPAGPERIEFPVETGRVLTTVSLESSLTSVGELSTGSLGNTFGSANVASLESRGNAMLLHNVELGTNQQDSLKIFSHIKTQQLVFNADSAGGKMVLSFPDPSSHRSIVMPDESGSMLTSSSLESSLTSVGSLVAGSIGGDFGHIVVNADIKSTSSSGVIHGAGGLHIEGGATLGDEYADEISIRGTFVVKNANSVPTFFIDPEFGDTTLQGNLYVRGVITTESPFSTTEFNVATINEYEADGGVTIEGVLMRDGGIMHTKIDRVDEMEPGKGVTIDGVVLKNGALITESATGTTAKGEVDMVRIINTGHDADMDETMTNIKFRQVYHDLTGAEEHEPADMVKLSAVTQSDWTQREESRDAYFQISVLQAGVMKERLRLTAEGNMLLNTDTIVVHGPTGYTLIHGDVTIGAMAGERTLTVSSTDNDANLHVKSNAKDANFAVTAGASGNAGATFTSGFDTDVRVALVDPTAGAGGIGYGIVLDGATNSLKINGVSGKDRTTYAASCNDVNLGGDPSTSATACAAVYKIGTTTSVCEYTPDDTNTVDVDEEACAYTSDASSSWDMASFNVVEETVSIKGTNHTYATPVGELEITGKLSVVNADVTNDLVTKTFESLGDTRLGSTYSSVCVASDRAVCAAANADQVTCEAAGASAGRCTWTSSGPKCTATYENACAMATARPECETTASGGGACTYTIVADTSAIGNVTTKITMGGAFAQDFLVVDADADEQNLLTIAFPHPSAPHTVSFPEETGEILTTSSKFSTLAAVGDVSVGNLVTVPESCTATDPAASASVKNLCVSANIAVADVIASQTNCEAAAACTYTPYTAFGSAAVTSVAVSAGSEFNGGTTIGDDTDDPIAFHGYLSVDHLIFDTDVDSQCLTLIFADPKTDYSFSGTEDLNGDGVIDEFVNVAIQVDLEDWDAPEELSWTLDQVTLEIVESCTATDPDAAQSVKNACNDANQQQCVVAADCTYVEAVPFSSTTVLSAQGVTRSNDQSYQSLQGSIKLLPDGKFYRFTIEHSGSDRHGIYPGGSVSVKRDNTELGSANQVSQIGGDDLDGDGNVYAFGKNAATEQEYVPWTLTFRAGSKPHYDAGVDEYCKADATETNPSTVVACENADISPPDDATSRLNCLNANPGCTYRPFLMIPVAPAALVGAGAPNPTYAKDRVTESCVATLGAAADQAVQDGCLAALSSVTATDVTVRKNACTAVGACTYVAAVHAHCDPGSSKTLHFPQEDGTLIVKNTALTDPRYQDKSWWGANETRLRTLLDGDVYLGTEFSDRIRFPGQIDHEIRYTDSSVILGANPLHFGSSTYGTIQVGESCTALYAPNCANVDLSGDNSASQTACLAVLIPGSTDPACTYTAENVGVNPKSCNATAEYACAAASLSELSAAVSKSNCESAKRANDMTSECLYNSSGSSPFMSSFRLTVGVPNLFADLNLQLPHEDGVLLSTSSEISALKVLGDLAQLVVDGNSTMKGDVVIGDNVGDKLTLASPVYGSDAIRFDGGRDLWPRAPHNVALNKPTVADSYSVAGGTQYPGDLATNGHTSGIQHRWISGPPQSHFHWLAIDLEAAQDISAIELWAADINSAPGKVCAYSVFHRPYTTGMTFESFNTIVADLNAIQQTMLDAIDNGSPPTETFYNNFRGNSNGQCTSQTTVSGSVLQRGCAGGWDQALDMPPTDPTSVGYSHDYREFPATVTTMHMRLDFDMSQGCTASQGTVYLFEVQLLGIPVRPLTTLKITPPSQDRDITLPDETGLVLTDTSAFSALTSVGALKSGSIVAGFGAAQVASLTSTGDSVLHGDVTLGSCGLPASTACTAEYDTLIFNGRVSGTTLASDATVQEFMVLEGVTNDTHTLTLAVKDPTALRRLVFPDEDGMVLTSTSTQSSLQEVGALSSGSIVSGFGPIVSSAVESTGLANLKGEVRLGSGIASLIKMSGSITTDMNFKNEANSYHTALKFPQLLSQTQDKVINIPVCADTMCTLLHEESLTSQLTAVGALASGSIVAGFGSITGGAMTSSGKLEGKTTVAFGYVKLCAEANPQIPDDKTVINVRQCAGSPYAGAAMTMAWPSAATDGQILFVRNGDSTSGTITMVTSSVTDGQTFTMNPGESSLFISMDGQWNQMFND